MSELNLDRQQAVTEVTRERLIQLVLSVPLSSEIASRNLSDGRRISIGMPPFKKVDENSSDRIIVIHDQDKIKRYDIITRDNDTKLLSFMPYAPIRPKEVASDSPVGTAEKTHNAIEAIERSQEMQNDLNLATPTEGEVLDLIELLRGNFS